MDRQAQHFQIANLIFTIPYDSTTLLTGKEIQTIQDRFLEIVNSFEGPEYTQYSTNYIKQGDSKLPYNAMTILGEINNRLILHFTFSYKEPVLFVIDISENKVKNYIDIESAKGILNDDTFQDIKDALHYPKNLNRIFKGVADINKFVSQFESLLQKHNNAETITGRDCFEVNLDDFGDR